MRYSATCCFLFLLSVHSLPTSASFPFKIGAVSAVEGSRGWWVVLLLQALQVQRSQTSPVKGVPTVSSTDPAPAQQKKRCHTTCLLISESSFSLRTLTSASSLLLGSVWFSLFRVTSSPLSFPFIVTICVSCKLVRPCAQHCGFRRGYTPYSRGAVAS